MTETLKKFFIQLNGKKNEVRDAMTLLDLLADLGIPKEKVVIERNLEIVPRETLATVKLEPNDTIEIIHFVGGGSPARALVIISPGARSDIKRWSVAGFARVAERLIAEAGAQVILSGEPAEEPIVQEVAGLMRHRALSAVGLTTIRQLGVLMQRAQLVIANDSAALHLASLLGVPTAAIFGPTDERKYGPTAPQRQTLRRRLVCAPCERALCPYRHECMALIHPDEVYESAARIVSAARLDFVNGALRISMPMASPNSS